MWICVEYIRRFLHAINKSTLNPCNTDLSIINSALGYNIPFKFGDDCESTENTFQVLGTHNKNYIIKTTALHTTSGHDVELFSGNLPVLLHKIQWESDTPLRAHLYMCNTHYNNKKINCLTHTNIPTSSMYFKHPLPMYIFEESHSVYQLAIKFTPKRPHKLHLFTSVLQRPLNPECVYYWSGTASVNLHSLQIALPVRTIGGYDITSGGDCASNCRCEHFNVHPGNTLEEYSISEHLLQ